MLKLKPSLKAFSIAATLVCGVYFSGSGTGHAQVSSGLQLKSADPGLQPDHATLNRLPLGTPTLGPLAWYSFCAELPNGCTHRTPYPQYPRVVIENAKMMSDLKHINKWVNERIKYKSDQDHWGVKDRWNYPDDGYGDCEDYALLKRRMLVNAGWPIEALLITIVKNGAWQDHVVLTVVTDKRDLILDQTNDIVPWSERTDLQFTAIQSPYDENSWMGLGMTNGQDIPKASIELLASSIRSTPSSRTGAQASQTRPHRQRQAEPRRQQNMKIG